MSHDVVIEAAGLTKVFPGGQVGVRHLDLRIRRGSVYGLIGRNGAGKTTALRLLMGLLQPDAGAARILGSELASAPRSVRARVAYVSQSQQLHSWMSLSELCRYVAHFYERWDASYARSLAQRWDLPWNLAIGRMSGGEQRKAAVLVAFASRAEVLILDEPAAGLDPIARRAFLSEMLEVISRAEGCTILFSTHIIGDLERIAEHVGIMERGRIMSSSRLDELQSTTRRVQAVFEADEPPAGFRIPGAIWTRTTGPVVTAVTRLVNDAQLDEIRFMPGVRVNIYPLGLEDIFVELLGQSGAEELTDPEPETAEAF
jgi:ABC-2 type transport system ATP-binding protein